MRNLAKIYSVDEKTIRNNIRAIKDAGGMVLIDVPAKEMDRLDYYYMVKD